MIRPDVNRPWDLMVLTGVEARLWRGVTVRADVRWFAPSPWGVYDQLRGQAERDALGNTSTPQSIASRASARAEQVYVDALNRPALALATGWEF